MVLTRRTALRVVTAFLAVNLPLSLLLGCLYPAATPGIATPLGWTFAAAALVSNTAMVYAVVWILVATLVVVVPRRRILLGIAVPLGVAIHAATVIDATLYRIFRYHFNSMVLNVLTTPGAWDSVDLGVATVATFVVAGVALGAAEVVLARRLLARAAAGDCLLRVRPAWISLALVAGIAVDKGVFAYADLYNRSDITRFVKLYPLYQPLTVKRLAQRAFGFRVNREEGLTEVARAATLRYPLHPLVRTPEAATPNVLVVLIDCWRYDMLNEEVTPNLTRFAAESVVLNHHYSGGNATRFGVFSILYGLYGYDWHAFLGERRSPVLLDALQGLGYDFKILSSTRLTYPEFRKSAFIHLADAIDDELPGTTGLTRDPEQIRRLLAWLGERPDPARPFFGFLFLDAPHGRVYPPEFARFGAGAQTNYLIAGEAEVAAAKRDYMNALAFNDALVGKLLDGLRKGGWLENTIVCFTGDHGEEFREHGYFGHTSAFTPEQVHVPCILHLPGVGHRQVDLLTSHLDFVPTVMEVLGYTNPPGDYSNGAPIFASERPAYAVSCGWADCAVIDDEATLVFSMESYGGGRAEVLDRDYRPVADRRAVLAPRADRLVAVTRGFSRFMR
ncbi:MAG: sulfatase-like hydrolase/transferase [Deltaproteobacteria bacterium]|nr:sulfatase-like hydrolase/transferase [Deltaproteobacteria bacterium]OIP65060.1 MAG: hypothetical protein AUK30_05475 [Nitrospirae bacterium CG2_30_70_394]PIW82451.1 MAG: hypothetical protein COZ96_08720 [Nitrospirae bacterium CG_4_8_14_3_um_filter_70_85]PIX83557.1 MAG: hypothetical protein COZ33_04870 [Nitrospirae bacterium CG_4_10_14_3_um_filter_70_108]PJB95457.1 MAG: hypothetical protein CO080_07540 [Nitrospirae bacterium CG_4_9_14_0_8_um_filter_70_14]HBB40557.1 hypothetical protein [Pseu